jgi:type I restriction enzyme S subunit
MQQLLTGKKRLPNFSEEWKEVKLGAIGEMFKGSGVPKDSIIEAGHKCLTYGDIYTKYDYVISNVKSYINDDIVSKSTKIQYGDICFAGSGETKEDIGKCAAFIDAQYGYAGGDIIIFRANKSNPITLSYILNSDSVIRQKSNMGQGHSVVHIYPYQLEKLRFKLPPKVEQDAIASILMDADKEIEFAKEKLANLQSQKRGLMQQLLTGKKRIKNIE